MARVWRGLSVTQCGMPYVPVHIANRSWLDCTLEASSIDMSFTPPLIVVQVYNLGDFHWVLRLWLIAQLANTFALSLTPHIVAAN